MPDPFRFNHTFGYYRFQNLHGEKSNSIMNSRTAHRISLAAGIAVLLLAFSGVLAPPPKPCGALPANYAPIIAFEMARSVADLQAIFGVEPGECRDAMRANLAASLAIEPSAVSIKGKTNEGMGWIGREEGLACIAVATVVPTGG